MVEKRKIIAGIVSTAIVLNALPGVPFWAAQEETEVICEVEELHGRNRISDGRIWDRARGG